MPNSGRLFLRRFAEGPPVLAVEALALKLGHFREIRTWWLGAACALSLLCACGFAIRADARAFADADKTANNKPANPKKHAQAAAKTSGTTSAASRHTAHPASHAPAGSHPKSDAAATGHPATSKHASVRTKKKPARGQQKIDSSRAQEIQEALVREHYLGWEATGKWNLASEDAMRRYQADHGWQTKTVPDARALINLGLGPSHDHLLNPESAMTTEPFPPHASSLTPLSHSADPGTRMNTPPPVDPPPAVNADPQ